jgi:UDP-N-acetylmuramoyl-tripeptide--D-alanyl-D-alanine ligase
MTGPTWNDYKRYLAHEAAPDAKWPTGPAPAFAQLSTDSRQLKAGDWFVPLSGENFEGHKFIAEVLAKGAAGFFYDPTRAPGLAPDQRARGLAVKDPLAALQAIARGWRRDLKNLCVLALTGSNGKTTTKEILTAILREAGPTHSTEASFNNEIGVPKTLLGATREHRYAILEFGARNVGNIRFLCQLAEPDIAAVILIGRAHVGIFGSVEALAATKLEMFRDNPRDAIQVAYADDPRIAAGAKATGRQTITFGIGPTCDCRIAATEWQPDGRMGVTLVVRGETMQVTLAYAHAALPHNAAAATAMALAAGVPLPTIKRGLEGFVGVKGRYQIHRRGTHVLVDDSYNANPDSMRAGLETLKKSFATQRTLLVLGDMLELGDEAAADHAGIGTFVGTTIKPSHLITVGPLSRGMADAAVAAGLPATSVEHFADVADMLRNRPDWQRLGDVIFVKASNGTKLSRVVAQFVGAPS